MGHSPHVFCPKLFEDKFHQGACFMKEINIYDLPTRAFHLVFAVLFVLSFSIGKFVDDESWLYAYHMISGFMMVFIVLLRVIWGIIGSKYAKFTNFQLNLNSLSEYLKGIASGHKEKHAGHNPASSYAAILMFVLTFLLVGSGLFMVNGLAAEFFEETHELLAHLFLVVVLLHLAGVLLHEFRYRDHMVFSMFNGRKKLETQNVGIIRNHSIIMTLFLFTFFTVGSFVMMSFDVESRVLKVAGVSLKLAEYENENKHSREYREHEGKHAQDHNEHDDEEYDDDDD